MHDHHSQFTDSAGQPWAGRKFDETAFGGDDGSAPGFLSDALESFHRQEVGETAVVDSIRVARLLIPLVAKLGEAGANDHGVTVDKSAELSIVTVAGPDGRNVLPVFSSVAAMQKWNPSARPVPADAVRVALAAADELTDLVVLDPTSDSEFVIRRPALWAIAQSIPWTPSYLDASVQIALSAAADGEPDVAGIALSAGDPDARLRGPELMIELALKPGLDQSAVFALLERLQSTWAASTVVAERVDSLAVKLVEAPTL